MTHLSFSELAALDDAVVLTYLDVFERMHAEQEKANRKARRRG